MSQFISITFFLVFLGLPGNDPISSEETYHITKIVDGDTFYARNRGGVKLKYRLIGINTPEFSHFGRPEQPFAQEATDFLTDLLASNTVRLEYDIDPQDKYGRELVYAYLPDGTFVNAALVKEGWAQIRTIQPNTKHADYFYKLQQQARTNKLGIWKDL